MPINFGDPAQSRWRAEQRRAEEDFWARTFGDPAASGPATTQRRVEPEYQRGWFERVFAPFQAPQEALFRFTTNVAEDGFSAHAVLDALGHGARYFNPWANIPMQDPDDIRQIFFGEQADASGFTRFGANLAISLLYDPLLFGGAAKAVGLLGSGAQAASRMRNINRVTNPAGALLEGMRHVAREQVGPTIHRMGRKAIGDARWEKHATRAAQWLTKRHAGMDPELVREARLFDKRLFDWRQEHYSILKQAEGLRGPEAQRILADALQSEAVYLNRTGAQLGKRQVKEFADIERRLQRAGVSEDLFYQVYDRARRLDDQVGQGLYELGLISRRDIQTYKGTHLKRMYAAFERPMEYVDRLEAIIRQSPELGPDIQRVSFSTLRKNLTDLGETIMETPGLARAQGIPEAGLTAARRDPATALGAAMDANPYFTRTGRGRTGFDAERFSGDLLDYLDAHSNATIEQVFDHVKHNMLGNVQMNERFYKAVGDVISNAAYVDPGLTTYASRLRELAHGGPGVTFRTLRENVEHVAAREKMRPEVLEALGEILEAAPRIAGQGIDNTQLLETRRLFDHIAGVRRVDEETGNLFHRAREMLARNEDVPQDLMQQISQRIGREVTPDDLARLDTGSVLSRTNNRWSSLERTAQHNMQLPNSENLGELAGRWVSAGTYLHFNRMAGRPAQAGEPAATMAGKLGEYIRQGVGQFKIMKVIMDPTAQFRNMIGNAILMDLQGTSPLRVDRLVKSGQEVFQYMKSHGRVKGRYMQMLEDAGVPLFDTTFSGAELREAARHLTRDLTRRNVKDGFVSIYDGIRRAIRDSQDAGMAVFEFNERLFKLNVFADQYEKLATGVARAGRRIDPDTQRSMVTQAAALAEQALFNYADVPYLIDFARKYGVVPFATFPFKAIPYAAKTLMENPHRVLKYDRIADRVNEEFAGGPLEVAREIQALPQHLRDNMVVRLPFTDNQDRPLYIDMAYYLPWSPLQQMIEQVQGGLSGLFGQTPEAGVGDFGMRGGVLTPPIMAVLDGLRHNVDSLDRPVFTPSMSQGERWLAAGKFITEFWLPPSAPGGSRGESVGRALQAMARNTPETQDWVDVVGRSLRLGGNQDRIIAGHGLSPQSQAIVDSPAGPIAGGIWALLAGGAHASDTQQSALNAAAEFRGNFTDLAREIARVRNNRTMSFEEKRARILRLQAEQQRMREEYLDYRSRL